MPYFAGLDWGSTEHAVCVIDDTGAVVQRFGAAHTAAGLAKLLAQLGRLADRGELPIAIERPSGLVVDTLVDAGHPVVPVHPNALKACRPRYTAAGGKSDPGDAYILADVLRTDGHRFRTLSPFLARNAYCGRRSAVELLKRLRAAPTGLAGPLEEEAKGEAVRDLVAVLQTLVGRIRRLTRTIEHAVAQLPAGQVVMSFPRAGRVNAAQIVAELGEDPERFQTEDQLAAEAGVAPVTHASGKRRGVTFRFACNKRLRSAITTWADNSRHSSPWAKQVYASARARGCDHPHAVRILARAWVRVLWRCWRDGVSYDIARHGAARHLIGAA